MSAIKYLIGSFGEGPEKVSQEVVDAAEAELSEMRFAIARCSQLFRSGAVYLTSTDQTMCVAMIETNELARYEALLGDLRAPTGQGGGRE